MLIYILTQFGVLEGEIATPLTDMKRTQQSPYQLTFRIRVKFIGQGTRYVRNMVLSYGNIIPMFNGT